MSNVINFQEARISKAEKALFLIEEERQILEQVKADMDLLKDILKEEELTTPVYEGNLGRDFTGQKYEATKNLDVKEIAKRIRADIKSAKKRGVFPKFAKVSVRIDRFSGGQAIRVNITSWEGEHLTPEYKEHQNDWRYMRDNNVQKYTDELNQAVEMLEEIMQAYNRDTSDTSTDYFNVNFYGHASVNIK